MREQSLMREQQLTSEQQFLRGKSLTESPNEKQSPNNEFQLQYLEEDNPENPPDDPYLFMEKNNSFSNDNEPIKQAHQHLKGEENDYLRGQETPQASIYDDDIRLMDPANHDAWLRSSYEATKSQSVLGEDPNAANPRKMFHKIERSGVTDAIYVLGSFGGNRFEVETGQEFESFLSDGEISLFNSLASSATGQQITLNFNSGDGQITSESIDKLRQTMQNNGFLNRNGFLLNNNKSSAIYGIEKKTDEELLSALDRGELGIGKLTTEEKNFYHAYRKLRNNINEGSDTKEFFESYDTYVSNKQKISLLEENLKGATGEKREKLLSEVTKLKAENASKKMVGYHFDDFVIKGNSQYRTKDEIIKNMAVRLAKGSDKLSKKLNTIEELRGGAGGLRSPLGRLAHKQFSNNGSYDASIQSVDQQMHAIRAMANVPEAVYHVQNMVLQAKSLHIERQINRLNQSGVASQEKLGKFNRLQKRKQDIDEKVAKRKEIESPKKRLKKRVKERLKRNPHVQNAIKVKSRVLNNRFVKKVSSPFTKLSSAMETVKTVIATVTKKVLCAGAKILLYILGGYFSIIWWLFTHIFLPLLPIIFICLVAINFNGTDPGFKTGSKDTIFHTVYASLEADETKWASSVASGVLKGKTKKLSEFQVFASYLGANVSGDGYGSYGGTAFGQISNIEMAKDIWEYLSNERGWSDIAIAAVLGNIEQESTFEATQQEKNPKAGMGGLGLMQWTGGRRTKFVSWMRQNGYALGNVKGQMEYLEYENQYVDRYAWIAQKGYSERSVSDFKRAYANVTASETDWSAIDKATQEWCVCWERPDMRTANLGRRIGAARDAYRRLSKHGSSYYGKAEQSS